jgi:DNA mismatch endonuclease, patch repair protein
LHDKKLPGKPDIVLPKYKTALFVQGCFWHAHEGCKFYRAPKSNTEYWTGKIRNNVSRDQLNQQALRGIGWNVIIVWECELKRDAATRCMELERQIKLTM